MANEISISLSITAEKNGAKFTRQESFQDDMTGDAWITGVQQVGSSSGTQAVEYAIIEL